MKTGLDRITAGLLSCCLVAVQIFPTCCCFWGTCSLNLAAFVPTHSQAGSTCSCCSAGNAEASEVFNRCPTEPTSADDQCHLPQSRDCQCPCCHAHVDYALAAGYVSAPLDFQAAFVGESSLRLQDVPGQLLKRLNLPPPFIMSQSTWHAWICVWIK